MDAEERLNATTAVDGHDDDDDDDGNDDDATAPAAHWSNNVKSSSKGRATVSKRPKGEQGEEVGDGGKSLTSCNPSRSRGSMVGGEVEEEEGEEEERMM